MEKYKSQNSSRNLLIAAIYLFFGIAILGMCFDLMQETFIVKLSKISEKIKDQTLTEINKVDSSEITDKSNSETTQNQKINKINIKRKISTLRNTSDC